MSWGQTTVSYPNQLPQRGVNPSGSYYFDKLEAIDKTTGLLSYRIPLTSMPLGRGGFSVPITLVYSSAQFDYEYSLTYESSPPYAGIINQALTPDPWGGWNVGYGYSLYLESRPPDCSGSENGGKTFRSNLIMPDGSHHILHIYGQWDDGNGFYSNGYTGVSSCPDTPQLTGDIYLYTEDNSFIKVVYHTSTGTWTASFSNGMTVNTADVQTIADANGNNVTISQSTGANNQPQTVLTDDLGRTVTISASIPYGYTVTQAGYGGASLTWQFGPAPNSQKTTVPFSYQCIPSEAQYCNSSVAGGGTDILQVPGGTSGSALTYTFSYGPNNGELQTVTLPTGASTTYTYQYQDYVSGFPAPGLGNPI